MFRDNQPNMAFCPRPTASRRIPVRKHGLLSSTASRRIPVRKHVLAGLPSGPSNITNRSPHATASAKCRAATRAPPSPALPAAPLLKTRLSSAPCAVVVVPIAALRCRRSAAAFAAAPTNRVLFWLYLSSQALPPSHAAKYANLPIKIREDSREFASKFAAACEDFTKTPQKRKTRLH